MSIRKLAGGFVGAFFILLLMTASARAEFTIDKSEFDPELLRIDEKEVLGTKVTDGRVFIDSDGLEFKLADLKEKAVILIFSYFTCDGFCPAFNADLMKVLEKVEGMKKVKAGDDFRIVTISFDGNDTLESAKTFKSGLLLGEHLEKNWQVAVFKDKEEIASLAKKLDYRFFWSKADRQFFHPNAYYFISPLEGRVMRVLHGKSSGADMELAILDAKFKTMRPSEIINLAVSLCYSYNYKDGKYGINYPMFFAFGSLFTGVTAFAVAATVVRKKQLKRKK